MVLSFQTMNGLVLKQYAIKFYSRQSLIVVYISYVLFMICCSLIFFENNHGAN